MRDNVGKVVIRAREADAQGVAVDRFEVRQLGVVIETARLLGGGGQRIEPLDLAGEHEAVGCAIGRIGKAHVAVHEILCNQFALTTLERRIGGKVDAGAQAKRIRLAIVGHVRQRFGRHRHELGGTREIIVGEKPLEDRLDHHRRVLVTNAHRVESRFRSLNRDTNYFGGIGRGKRGRCQCRQHHQKRADRALKSAQALRPLPRGRFGDPLPDTPKGAFRTRIPAFHPRFPLRREHPDCLKDKPC